MALQVVQHFQSHLMHFHMWTTIHICTWAHWHVPSHFFFCVDGCIKNLVCCILLKEME